MIFENLKYTDRRDIPVPSGGIGKSCLLKGMVNQLYGIRKPRFRRMKRHGILALHWAWLREASLYYSISNCFAFVSGNVRTVKAARIAKMEAVPREKP